MTIRKTSATRNGGLLKKPVRSAAVRRRRRIRQTLDRFVVIATNNNDVPRTTTGWTATLTRGTTTITANFDDFGVARFDTISTLTTVSYVLRIRNADGELQVTRNVPADREVYVARF
ncbi:hypothetical protein [Paenibacillus lemnae]|uniref:Uncharacterized protein n=1 Tax=Paenibacillus lemnae TaxID=1330551 RepID=A0A848M0D8_PAELE|nr:hypothetical protein [Paenibacillus lemnae]NMO94368.1 hypothetical protein [Paenibacillus lemnae]